MLAVSVIALATQASGAAGDPTSPPSADRALADVSVSAPEKKCSARKAVRFYSRKLNEHRARVGAEPVAPGGRAYRSPRGSCPRYLAGVLQRKARAARKYADRYISYHYHWWKWLPSKWQRIGACETGYGRRPGQWTWNSGTYQGAFGFYHGTWDQYKPAGAPSEAYLATPRQQYQCALNVYAAHGYGAWGCGGA